VRLREAAAIELAPVAEVLVAAVARRAATVVAIGATLFETAITAIAAGTRAAVEAAVLRKGAPRGHAHCKRRGGNGRNVTFPARSYAVNGERRSFALLRPVADVTAQNTIREMILEAYQEYEERAAVAS
jgi:hypothetical protein